ncbi:hypothetical protein ACFQPA_10035 [Halomarina halobia]|uniref:Uncharacterized protein n=1 Tax=Halomarina halobia TaxID=3033386 RepID=A0ABD6AAI7_9EURY|nr:hypothetical protein [Halomarina sp. PSR21]
MSNRRRLEFVLRSKLRAAGRQYGEAKEAYRAARAASEADLPIDEGGNARVVCRRYAEKRSVELDAGLRPDCYDADHVDCRGCVEDIRDGRIETW